jgi:ABC-type xylose transport system permease subunit
MGIINGLLVWKLGIPAIVVTLGTMSIYRGIIFLLSGGGWVNSNQMGADFLGLPRAAVLGLPVLSWCAIAALLLVGYFLRYSRTGRALYTAGGNATAAYYTGINAGKMQFVSFCLSGALAGFCGYLWISRFAVAYVDVANGFELQVVAACVIGGISTMGGTGRVLGCLFVQGNAPKFLTRVSRRGVPVNSLILSGAITSLVVLVNYLLPHEAFGLLMALVVATLLLNWIMICLAHLRFRAAMRRKGRETQFKALLYPAGNYLCIAFLAMILVLMCTMDGMRTSAILLPVWVVFLFVAFKLSRKK